MEFTRDIIKEFWFKEFSYGGFSFNRHDWTPDKYNVVARYDDTIMRKTAVLISQFLDGVHNAETDYLLECSGGWYKNMYATSEEVSEIDGKFFGNTKKYFFGSKKYKEVKEYLMPIFGDLFFFSMFDNPNSPLYVEGGAKIKID